MRRIEVKFVALKKSSCQIQTIRTIYLLRSPIEFVRQWNAVSIGWQWLVDITQRLAKLSWLFVKKTTIVSKFLAGSNVSLDTVFRYIGAILCPLESPCAVTGVYQIYIYIHLLIELRHNTGRNKNIMTYERNSRSQLLHGKTFCGPTVIRLFVIRKVCPGTLSV